MSKIFTNKNRSPLLSREREFKLALRWQKHKDEKAMHELVLAYGRLVASLAFRYRNYGLPTNDLVQEGNIGLLQAIQRFEPSKGVRFSTYANWWVRAAMQEHILRNWSIVRTGTTAAQKSLFFNFRRLKLKIKDSNSIYLSPIKKQQIAEKLGVTYDDVDTMEGRLTGSDQSLNKPLGQKSEEQWQDKIVDKRPHPEELTLNKFDTQTLRAWLRNALSYLTEREQHIIGQRRLKDNCLTLEELGQELGISKERVRQIEKRAIEKLRQILLKKAGPDFANTIFGDI